MNKTTPIHTDEITKEKYIGNLEIDGYEIHILAIEHPSGSYLVSGSACNTGLIPDKAMVIDSALSIDENLQQFVADLESGEYPSGELLEWHGSLVI